MEYRCRRAHHTIERAHIYARPRMMDPTCHRVPAFSLLYTTVIYLLYFIPLRHPHKWTPRNTDVRVARFIYIFSSRHTKTRRLTITASFSTTASRRRSFEEFSVYVFRPISFVLSHAYRIGTTLWTPSVPLRSYRNKNIYIFVYEN
jgi:hypothetical protein